MNFPGSIGALNHLPAGLAGKLPVILYELNEVPWRVIDWYIERRPRSTLAKLLGNAAKFTTVTRDEGELHPWTTWPTLHRGVDNRTHKIRFLNQDKSCADAWPPIWEEAARAGVRVGVFGSLQSYPVPERPDYAFYVPDTFARDPDTKPSRYSVFQRVNLRQTRADGAEPSDVRLDGNFLRDVLGLKRVGVRLRTYFALARQLLNEPLDRRHRSRRAMLQAPVAFDVFSHALKQTNPDFATFFTNHVAGIMHRYWKFSFPEDFGHPPGTALDPFHARSLEIAMDIADAQLGELKDYVDSRGGQLVVASSMGQEAIDWGEYYGELRITDAHKFARAIGFDEPFTDHLAMQPDFNFEFQSAADRERFCVLVEKLVDGSGECIFPRRRWEGTTLNLGLGMPRDIIESGQILRREDDGRLIKIPLEEAGFRKLWRDEGTGYHQPRGSLIWYSANLNASTDRIEIDSTEVRGLLLQALGISRSETQ